MPIELEIDKLEPFGSNQSLSEASVAALLIRRARERNPAYFPEELYNELLISVPSVSIETVALSVDSNANVYFNLVPRSTSDIVKPWRGRNYGRGVMLRTSEVEEDGSIQESWKRLISSEFGKGIISKPFEVATQPLDTGGRGKELAWIHLFQVRNDLKEGINIPIEELHTHDIIPHHMQIIWRFLDEMPRRVGRRQTDYKFVDEHGVPSLDLSMEVARKLAQHRDNFPKCEQYHE